MVWSGVIRKSEVKGCWFGLQSVGGYLWSVGIEDLLGNGEWKRGWGKFWCGGVMEWVERMKNVMKIMVRNGESLI